MRFTMKEFRNSDIFHGFI